MQVIKVNAIPINEVMLDLGKSIGVEVLENCNELRLKLPDSLGEGAISGIQFNNGLGMLQYDCMFHKDTEIRFLKSEIHPLKFLYILKGCLKHSFSNNNVIHEIDQYQHAIVASQRNNGHILKFDKDIQSCFSSIELDREKFEEKIACKLKGVSADLAQVFKDTKAINSFYHQGYYSLKVVDIFKDLNKYKKRDFTRKLLMEGFALQMLAEEIKIYEDSQKEGEDTRFITVYELSAVKEAASFIENHISQDLNVKLLSKMVGVNQNKLQQGFKSLYGKTVRNYIIDYRLRITKTLLATTDLQMAEISEKVGINSRSYFSKIFKKRYGLSPKDFQQKQF